MASRGIDCPVNNGRIDRIRAPRRMNFRLHEGPLNIGLLPACHFGAEVDIHIHVGVESPT
jgi:hypothetical protein